MLQTKQSENEAQTDGCEVPAWARLFMGRSNRVTLSNDACAYGENIDMTREERWRWSEPRIRRDPMLARLWDRTYQSQVIQARHKSR